MVNELELIYLVICILILQIAILLTPASRPRSR